MRAPRPAPSAQWARVRSRASPFARRGEFGRQHQRQPSLTCHLPNASSKGQYADAVGSYTCTPAPIGTFVNETGSNTYTSCEKGRYASVQGSKACFLCDAGKFTNATGTVTCTACVAGRFQPDEGSTGCGTCPEGRVSPVERGITCSACSSGRYMSTSDAAAAKTYCESCVAG